MYYSVQELRSKLEEKVTGLGIDPKFKENPAYASALESIDSLIGQMNMFEAAEAVTAREEQGNISFEWTSSVGTKYSMTISCSNPETFKCISTEEKKPFTGTNGQLIRQKEAIEVVATIDKSSGFITLVTNGSTIDNVDCSIGKSNNSTWARQEYYTSDGINIQKEYKRFSRGELTEDIDRAGVDSMLYTPRLAVDGGFMSDKYETRELLIRDKLDTARYFYLDKSQGMRYSAITPLNQEHGLSKMFLPNGDLPQNIEILPLSTEEIEAMIQRENDPKIKEGLRKYAEGRENYYYNTSDDKYFECEGMTDNKVSSR